MPSNALDVIPSTNHAPTAPFVEANGGFPGLQPTCCGVEVCGSVSFKVVEHQGTIASPLKGAEDAHLPDLDSGAKGGVVRSTERFKGRYRGCSEPRMVRSSTVSEKEMGPTHGHNLALNGHPNMQRFVLVGQPFRPGRPPQRSTKHLIPCRKVGLWKVLTRQGHVQVMRHGITNLQTWQRSSQ